MIRVARSGRNTLNIVRIPIVFVPGVMGSRLEVTDLNEQWDPDSKWSMLHWFRIDAWREREELGSESVARVMTDRCAVALNTDEQHRGWEGVAWGFYGEFLRQLNRQPWGEGSEPTVAVQCPVYAVGYDWRQSNTVSARRLNQQITGRGGILERAEADRVIIVTHSMGGLVARRAVQLFPDLRQRIVAVVHTVQPCAGAAVAYRRFVTGATWPKDGGGAAGYVLSRVIGNEPWEYAALMSVLPGPMQLLPTNHLRDTAGGPWLKYETSSGRIGDSSIGDIFGTYTDAESPPGILNYATAKIHASRGEVSYRTGADRFRTVEQDLRIRVKQAQTFHRGLGDQEATLLRHDRTWTIFSSGVTTDVALEVSPAGWFSSGADDRRRAEGDETVPEASAMARFPGERDSSGTVVEGLRQLEVRGIGHADACHPGKAPQVYDRVVAVIRQVLFGPQPAPSSTSEAP